MKRIINGKRYNTDAAKEVAFYDNSLYGSLDFIEETLYRKQTGEYFIHGTGGANTKYAVKSGTNHWTSGERLMPLSNEEAQAWAEQHLNADEYDRLFGENISDSKKVVTFRLKESTLNEIAKRAVEQGISKSELIEKMIGV